MTSFPERVSAAPTSRRAAALATAGGGAANLVLISAQALVLMPLLLKALGPKLYGAWLGSGDVLLWAQALDLGLPNLMIQRIGAAHGRGDEGTVWSYLTTGSAVLGVLAAVVAAGAVAVGAWVPGWFGLHGEQGYQLRACFSIGAVATGLVLFNYAFVGFSRAVQDTAFLNAVMVASTLVAFGVTLAMLLAGYGLWSAAWGMVARALVSLAGSAVFLARRLRGGALAHVRFSKAWAKEMLVVSPATAAGGIAYALATQSENALVGVLLGPELVPVLALTRKGADVLRALLDTISYGIYGGFAHLVASSERARVLCVRSEVGALRLSLAVVLGAAYLAANRSFVTVWVGPAYFGGPLLTALIAGQMIFVSGAYFANYIYRACGQVVKGSLFLVVECVCRLPLMAVLVTTLGLVGIPLAAIATSLVALTVTNRLFVKEVSSYALSPERARLRVVVVRVLIAAGGIAMCAAPAPPSWAFALFVGGLVASVGAWLLVVVDPRLAGLRSQLVTAMRRPLARRGGAGGDR